MRAGRQYRAPSPARRGLSRGAGEADKQRLRPRHPDLTPCTQCPFHSIAKSCGRYFALGLGGKHAAAMGIWRGGAGGTRGESRTACWSDRSLRLTILAWPMLIRSLRDPRVAAERVIHRLTRRLCGSRKFFLPKFASHAEATRKAASGNYRTTRRDWFGASPEPRDREDRLPREEHTRLELSQPSLLGSRRPELRGVLRLGHRPSTVSWLHRRH